MNWWSRFLDCVSPRMCVICNHRLAPTEHSVCCSCLFSLHRTDFHLTPYDNKMARLFWGLVPIEKAAAFVYFHPHSDPAQMVYQLKYANHPDIGIDLGRIMAQEMIPSDFFQDIDALLPVPLADKRMRQRGYNQSEYLALGIADELGIPYVEILKAVRPHSTQTHKGALERWQNIQDNYALKKDADRFAGQHILLVDDVITTGSTLTVCAALLKSIPGTRVSLFTLAAARLE